MVSQGQTLFTTNWWVVTFPGLAILVTAFAFNFLGEGLRTALDPEAGAAMIGVRDLKVRYGDGVVARVPELDVRRGRCVGDRGGERLGQVDDALALLGLTG